MKLQKLGGYAAIRFGMWARSHCRNIRACILATSVIASSAAQADPAKMMDAYELHP